LNNHLLAIIKIQHIHIRITQHEMANFFDEHY
jgi:hypothetical protein